MRSLAILWIFPTVSMLIFSLFSFLLGSISLSTLGYVFLLAAVPAFLLALVCIKFRYHQRNVFQLAFFAGVIDFFYNLTTFSILSVFEPLDETLFEGTLAIFLIALMFALAAIMYAIVILRLFLPKTLEQS